MGDGAGKSEAVDFANVDYGSGAAVLIFCDDPARRAQIAALVRSAGGRVSVALGLGEAIERIEAHAAPETVVVEIAAGHGRPEAVEAIFDLLEQGARGMRFRSVALIPPELIDLAASRISHRDVEILCGDGWDELARLIPDLTAPRGLRLSDVSADGAPERLRELSEQVGRLARMLALMSHDRGETAPGNTDEGSGAEGAAEALVDPCALRLVIRARRLRDQYFGSEIFADPAWDMLLDLMAARLEGQPVAVSSLCIASAVPPTTALRWIKTMTEVGLFVRVADPKDRRRVFIELAPRAVEAMGGYIGAARRLSGVAI